MTFVQLYNTQKHKKNNKKLNEIIKKKTTTDTLK